MPVSINTSGGPKFSVFSDDGLSAARQPGVDMLVGGADQRPGARGRQAEFGRDRRNRHLFHPMQIERPAGPLGQFRKCGLRQGQALPVVGDRFRRGRRIGNRRELFRRKVHKGHNPLPPLVIRAKIAGNPEQIADGIANLVSFGGRRHENPDKRVLREISGSFLIDPTTTKRLRDVTRMLAEKMLYVPHTYSPCLALDQATARKCASLLVDVP